jgi:hypothetical protein
MARRALLALSTAALLRLGAARAERPAPTVVAKPVVAPRHVPPIARALHLLERGVNKLADAEAEVRGVDLPQSRQLRLEDAEALYEGDHLRLYRLRLVVNNGSYPVKSVADVNPDGTLIEPVFASSPAKFDGVLGGHGTFTDPEALSAVHAAERDPHHPLNHPHARHPAPPRSSQR